MPRKDPGMQTMRVPMHPKEMLRRISLNREPEMQEKIREVRKIIYHGAELPQARALHLCKPFRASRAILVPRQGAEQD